MTDDSRAIRMSRTSHLMQHRLWLSALGLIVGLISQPPTAGAHHSFAAEFDADAPVELTGTVTNVDWTNPHARLYIDVVDENGDVENWNFELSSPNGLMRRGWRRDSLKFGDVVSVTGFRAKRVPHVGNARRVDLADGRELLAGSSFDDAN